MASESASACAVEVRPLCGARADRFLSLLSRGSPQARFGPTGCVLGARFADSVHEIRAFEVRPDDVWVVTPPKCGTTWTQEMVWLLLNDLNFEEAKKTPINLRSPFIEGSRFSSEEEAKKRGYDTVTYSASLPSPRCIKSHLHKTLLPCQIWEKNAKVIFVARDPKDAAVSFYHHYNLFGDYKGDKDFFFECYLDDIVEHAPIWEHILEFWKIRNQPNVLFSTFEEMKQDLPGVIKRTAAFLGKTLTEDQLQNLAKHLDFEQMKNNPSANYENILKKSREEGEISEDQAFIRKGVVGEGKREMAPEMAERFDERTRRVFNKEVGCPWKI